MDSATSGDTLVASCENKRPKIVRCDNCKGVGLIKPDVVMCNACADMICKSNSTIKTPWEECSKCDGAGEISQ